MVKEKNGLEGSPKKVAKREPSQATLIKKIVSVSDSNKALQKEIKTMSKIFGENQKVLMSMKDMIDTLASMLGYIQKQSKQIGAIENDAQKMHAELDKIKTQSGIISKIDDQTAKMQIEVKNISDLQKASRSQKISQQVEDSMESIKNNSQMIIKMAQRIDEVKDDLKKVSGKTDSFLEISSEMNKLENSIKNISKKTAKMDTGAQIIASLKQELESVAEGVSSTAGLISELDVIKDTIDAISSKASKIDSLGKSIEELRRQFEDIETKADSADSRSVESIKEISGKMDKIETEIGTLSHRADATAFVGEGLKSVQEDFVDFKQNILDKTDGIEKKVSFTADTLKRQDASVAEYHKKSEELFSEIRDARSAATKASNDSAKEVMALLKLSEYQSNVRMNAESKYGDAEDLEKMARKTAEIINLFDRVSIESGERIPLPHEVRQWSVAKILDCADRWEVRFGEVYPILTNFIGRDMLKEAVRIQQIRDIYGIRAVDEIRRDLNMV